MEGKSAVTEGMCTGGVSHSTFLDIWKFKLVNVKVKTSIVNCTSNLRDFCVDINRS